MLASMSGECCRVAPDYPRIMKFLEFWKAEIEGALHSVRIASGELIKPVNLNHCDSMVTLH